MTRDGGAPETSAAPAIQVADDIPHQLTPEAMTQLITTGQARHLATHVTDFTTWQDRWWTAGGQSWLLVDDPELHATLDRYHRRMNRGLLG